MSYQLEYEDTAPLIDIARAQWLSKLSVVFPYERKKALCVMYLVLATPLVAAIVCLCLGLWIPAFVLVGLCVVGAILVLHQAQVHRGKFQNPSSESLRLSQFRSGQARVKRSPLYDMYLPPGPKESVICALLFIPDARVDYMAYAGVATKLSDQGILVVLQNTEPHRLPSTLVGSGEAELKAIMQDVNEKYTIKEWAIGGHNMGTCPAAFLVEKLGLSKLVLWGTYSLKGIDLSQSKINVLAVMASNDGLLTSKSESEMKKFRSLLPPEAGTASSPDSGSTTYHMIPGGNHSGFANYGPTPQDGERDIRLEDQHKSCVDVTSIFLKRAQSFYYGRKSEAAASSAPTTVVSI